MKKLYFLETQPTVYCTLWDKNNFPIKRDSVFRYLLNVLSQYSRLTIIPLISN